MMLFPKNQEILIIYRRPWLSVHKKATALGYRGRGRQGNARLGGWGLGSERDGARKSGARCAQPAQKKVWEAGRNIALPRDFRTSKNKFCQKIIISQKNAQVFLRTQMYKKGGLSTVFLWKSHGGVAMLGPLFCPRPLWGLGVVPPCGKQQGPHLPPKSISGPLPSQGLFPKTCMPNISGCILRGFFHFVLFRST